MEGLGLSGQDGGAQEGQINADVLNMINEGCPNYDHDEEDEENTVPTLCAWCQNELRPCDPSICQDCLQKDRLDNEGPALWQKD